MRRCSIISHERRSPRFRPRSKHAGRSTDRAAVCGSSVTISPVSAAAATRRASWSSSAVRRSPTVREALVTVGAAQSNHCRMTAAAGARLGLDVHLVLSGDAPAAGRTADRQPAARRAVRSADASHRAPRRATGASSRSPASRSPTSSPLRGSAPCSIPIGGSTAVGALGYASAFVELIEQCRDAGFVPSAGRVHVVERWDPRRPARRSRGADRRRGGSPPTTSPTSSPSVSPRASTSACPTSPNWPMRHSDLMRRRRRRSIRPTSRSTPGGSATTTPCRRRRATPAIHWAAAPRWLDHGSDLLGQGVVRAARPGRRGPVGWRRPRRLRPHRWVAGAVRLITLIGRPSPRVVPGRTAGADERRDPRRRPAGLRDRNVRAASSRRRRRHPQPRDRVRLHEPRLSDDLLDTAYGMLREFFEKSPEEKQHRSGAGRQRADGLHRAARRDGRVERQARLEGDAQLVDADRRRATR